MGGVWRWCGWWVNVVVRPDGEWNAKSALDWDSELRCPSRTAIRYLSDRGIWSSNDLNSSSITEYGYIL